MYWNLIVFLCWIDYWNMTVFGIWIGTFPGGCTLMKLIPGGSSELQGTTISWGLTMFSWWCLALMKFIFREGWTCFRDGVPLPWNLYFVRVQTYFVVTPPSHEILFSCEFCNSHELISWRWPPRNTLTKRCLQTWRCCNFRGGHSHEISTRK